MSSSLVQRRIRFSYENNKKPNKFHFNFNKKWWNALKPQSGKEGTHVQVDEKVLDQVSLDVQRAFSFKNIPFTKREIDEKKVKLLEIIQKVLSRNANFKYYQGFHEICTLFFLVFEEKEEQCVLAVETFAQNNLPIIFKESFDGILREKTGRVLKVVERFTLENGRIRRSSDFECIEMRSLVMELKEVVEPHGLIAGWFLTWFVHEFPQFEDSMRIFDFQLTELTELSEPNEMCCSADEIIAAALLLIYKTDLINWTDGPFERIMFLRNLPKIVPIHDLITCSRQLKSTQTSLKDFKIVKLWIFFIVSLFLADLFIQKLHFN